MEPQSQVKVFNEALGVKGAKGKLLKIHPEGYYEVALEVNQKYHQALLPINGHGSSRRGAPRRDGVGRGRALLARGSGQQEERRRDRKRHGSVVRAVDGNCLDRCGDRSRDQGESYGLMPVEASEHPQDGRDRGARHQEERERSFHGPRDGRRYGTCGCRVDVRGEPRARLRASAAAPAPAMWAEDGRRARSEALKAERCENRSRGGLVLDRAEELVSKGQVERRGDDQDAPQIPGRETTRSALTARAPERFSGSRRRRPNLRRASSAIATTDPRHRRTAVTGYNMPE